MSDQHPRDEHGRFIKGSGVKRTRQSYPRHNQGPVYNHPLHWTWRGMIARCERVTERYYKDYGGRGIKVCERWRKSLANFAADMGERPTGATLDRIDNNGNYEPGNCRWATKKQQNRNARSNRYITVNGERMTMGEAAERFGLSRGRIWDRLNRGWDETRAATEPSRQQGSGHD